MGIPFDILDRMPTRDRKYYIMKHNNETNKGNKNSEGSSTTEAIDKYTDIYQKNIQNLKR